MTQSKVATRRMTKDPVDADLAGGKDRRREGVIKGLAEVVTNDRGETDLIDFQYFAFNLVALGLLRCRVRGCAVGGAPRDPTYLACAIGGRGRRPQWQEGAREGHASR
jgi:hypothetical protein